MKVLLDFRVHAGGAGRYGRELIQGLRAQDSVHVSVHGVSQGALGTTINPPFTPWGRASIRRAARRYDADLIHGLHFEVPHGTRSVVTMQDVIPLEHPDAMPNPIRRALFQRIVRSSIRNAERIIVPSDLTRSALGRYTAADKINVIPLWVSPTILGTGPSDRQRARDTFAEGEPYVAAIWHGRAHKNLHALTVAAQRLSGAKLLLLGRPPINSLNDRDLAAFLGGAEVFVIPSLIEGFGLPAAEAMACGAPVVCGEGLGALPHLRSGALVVDVTDPWAIAEAMNRVVEDHDLRETMSAAGREAARSLTLEAAVEATVAVYSRLLEEHA